MLKLKHFVSLGSLLAMAGCGFGPGTRPEGADFQGKLTNTSGKPIPGVTVLLLPTTAQALPTGGIVGKDGSFTGKAIPGEYVFSVEAVSETPRARALLKGINRRYLSPDAANKVTIVAGKPVDIKLAN